MFVVPEAYNGFSNLLDTRRGHDKSLKSFETRFLPAVARLNSFSMTTELQQCTTALILLNNSTIKHLQRVSTLSVAAPTVTSFSARSNNEGFLKVVTYSQVSSIVKQSEKSEHVPGRPYRYPMEVAGECRV